MRRSLRGESPLKGVDVKLARMLCAIGIMAALAGCKTCWIDRDADRPTQSGSIRDGLDYGWGGECFHPLYHCKPQDGFCDQVTVKRAAIKAANRALSEQNCGETSRDFRYGFQQAFVDISNGGSGTLPAVPPPRYWAGPYRTTWGHNKAREWFSGYEAGASAAKCCMPANTISVPTSVFRGEDNRLAVGLDGGSFGTAPMVNTNFSGPGGFGGGATAPASPMIGNPASMNPYPSSRYLMPQYGPMAPMTNPPASNAPYSNGVLGGGSSYGPSPSMPVLPAPYNSFPTNSVPTYQPPLTPSPNYPVPNYPSPNYPVPNFGPSPVPSDPTLGSTEGGGHSIPVPAGTVVNPPVTPMNGQRMRPPVVPQRASSPSNPWGQFRGMSGFGFKPEGVSR